MAAAHGRHSAPVCEGSFWEVFRPAAVAPGPRKRPSQPVSSLLLTLDAGGGGVGSPDAAKAAWSGRPIRRQRGLLIHRGRKHTVAKPPLNETATGGQRPVRPSPSAALSCSHSAAPQRYPNTAPHVQRRRGLAIDMAKSDRGACADLQPADPAGGRQARGTDRNTHTDRRRTARVQPPCRRAVESVILNIIGTA